MTGPISGEGQAPEQSLPPFFKAVAALDAGAHGALRLDRSRGFGFAAGANALPVGFSEIPLAALDYPVVLAGGPSPVPVAILGYRAGENLFVDAGGTWLDHAYLPAYVRSYPFILIEPPGAGSTFLGIETTAELLGETGEPLFAAGKPAPLVTDAMKLAVAYRDQMKAAADFGRALDEAGLLVEHEARLTFESGGTARLDGFRVVDGARLDALDSGIFLAWRQRGWLGALYALVQSGARWGKIVNLANRRRAGEAAGGRG
jgi:hypothetical protein